MKAFTYALTITLLFCALPAFAQEQDVDFMRSMGKMYVVVAVIITIFLGLVVVLFRLDRRLTSIENQIKNHE